MKLIGVELVKQDDQSDQWIVTYRYQAGSEREAMVHASDTVEKANPGIVWVSGRSTEDCQRISDHIRQNVDFPIFDDDPAVVKQRKDRTFQVKSFREEVNKYKSTLGKFDNSELESFHVDAICDRDMVKAIAIDEVLTWRNKP